MGRQKDGVLMANIAVKKLEGKSQEVIAQEVGVCRQTVSAYLRSPEAQAIFSKTEENALSFLNNAFRQLQVDLDVLGSSDNAFNGAKVRAEMLVRVITALGSKVLGTGAKVSASTMQPVQFSPEDRQERIDTLKKLLLEDGVTEEVKSEESSEIEKKS